MMSNGFAEQVADLDRRIRLEADPAAAAFGTEPEPRFEEPGYEWDSQKVADLVALLETSTEPLPGRVVESTIGLRRYFHHFGEDGEHRGSVYVYVNPETGQRVIQRVFEADLGDDYELPKRSGREAALLVKLAVERAGITADDLRDELAARG